MLDIQFGDSTGKYMNEQVRQQTPLRASEERFRATFEQAAVGIAHVAADGSWLRVNQKLCDIVGYTRDELLARSSQDITHPDDLETDLAYVRKMLAGGISTYTMEKRYFRKDGSIVWINLTVSLVRNSSGAPDYFISVVEDISERKRSEEKVRLLQSIALAVSEAPDLNSGLEIVLRKVCAATGWVYSEAWLPCEENAHLQCAITFYAGEADLKDFAQHSRGFRLARGQGLPGRVWDSRRPLWIPDVTQDPNFPRATLAREAGLRAALGVPVLAGEEIVAILVFFVHEARPEDERLVGVVSAVAAQLSLVIHRKRIEEALQRSETQLRTIFEVEPECVKVMKADGTLLQINPAGLAIIEAERPEEVVGRSVFGMVAPEYREEFQAFTERASRGDSGNLEFEIVGLKGTRRWLETHAVPFCGPSADAVPLVLAVTRDISERKRAEDELTRMAYYDDVTGLPNRLLFNDRLGQAMIDARRRERLVGVALLDLDQFKKINDTLGHETGNALLQAVGARLSAALRPSDTVARLGGDEFAMVLADMAHVDDATLIIQKIMQAFAQPFPVNGSELFVTTSLGITFYPFDDTDARALLRNADIAMYRAKEAGRSTCQFYTAEMTQRAREDMVLENALRHAIERSELTLHYQPIVNLRNGRILALEALLRWQHPERGLISPAHFIPLAEESGLIVPIGEWVLHQACTQMRTWRDAGHTSLHVAVNLSSRQFRQPDMVERILSILADTGLEGLRLELELTESILLANVEKTVGLMQRLDAAGVRFAIDDFGTGYSSLSYLKRFPIDILKIDQSFVRDISADTDDAAIVRAIITMAHSLGIQTVAEGVETAEQLHFLRANNCDAMQGYYFSKPQPADAITRLLKDGKTLSLQDRRLKPALRGRPGHPGREN